MTPDDETPVELPVEPAAEPAPLEPSESNPDGVTEVSPRKKMGPPHADHTGKRFGRLRPVEYLAKRWRCLCDCGAEVMVPAASLVTGGTRSCGCLRREKGLAAGAANLVRRAAAAADRAASPAAESPPQVLEQSDPPPAADKTDA